MQKIPFMLIVGEEEEKTAPFLSVVMDRKRKYHRYNRRICCYCRRRDQKNIKSIQFNLNYKVIAIRSNRGYQPQKKGCPQNKQSYSWYTRSNLVGENIEPGVLNFQKLYV
jgi:hypothetical protein